MTKVASKTVDETAEQRARERLELAHDQQVQLRREAMDLLAGIAACSQAYEASIERGAPWPWPDGTAIVGHPDTWKRLPALMFLLTRLSAVQRQLDWQSSMMEPFWCPECAGFEGGKGYLSAYCVEHDVSPAASVNMGTSLFGGK